MLATPVGIQRLLEGDVGRVVAGNATARVFFAHLRAWTRRGLVQQRGLPAVVLGLVAHRFEAPLRIRRGATTLDARGRDHMHPASIRASVSTPATSRIAIALVRGWHWIRELHCRYIERRILAIAHIDPRTIRKEVARQASLQTARQH